MNQFNFPYGTINILQSNIAEIIINDGIVIDKEIVRSYRNVLESHLDLPYALLINKVHGYSYTFDAQLSMGQLQDNVAYRAVVVYSKSAEMATQIVMNINKHNNWKIKIFRNREAALNWLIDCQNNKNAI